MHCHRFLADRFVEGICPHCGYEDARGDQCDGCSRTLDAIELVKPRCLLDKTHSVITQKSAHMYLKLNEIQGRNEEWIKRSWQAGKWSPNAVISNDGELIDARLKAGLLPTPLTRDLQWGVPVPIEEEDVYGMKGKVLCMLPLLYLHFKALSPELYRCLGMFIVIICYWSDFVISSMLPLDTQVSQQTTRLNGNNGGSIPKMWNSTSLWAKTTSIFMQFTSLP